MTIVNSSFQIGDSVKITDSSWEHSWDILCKFGFKKDAVYEVSGVYANGVISLKGATATYYPSYFELAKEDEPVYADYLVEMFSGKELLKEAQDLMSALQEAEHTGGSVNYYKVHVANPTTLPEAYDAEANDIIESLGLTFAEGNLFKAIWRMAADRNGKKKKGNNSVYDAEKLVFFAERVLVQEKAKGETN